MRRSLTLQEEFGILVLAKRLDAGLTQEDLAKKVGLPKSFISRTERGEASPDAAKRLEICMALYINPTDLVDLIISGMGLPKLTDATAMRPGELEHRA